jgi:hypothetical protein
VRGRQLAGVVEPGDPVRDVLPQPLRGVVGTVDDVRRQEVGQVVAAGGGADRLQVLLERDHRQLDLVVVGLVVRVDQRLRLLGGDRAGPHGQGDRAAVAATAVVRVVATGGHRHGAGDQRRGEPELPSVRHDLLLDVIVNNEL